jgi:hypothetical protein
MTRTFKIAAITAALLTTAAPAVAGNGTTPLGNCYNHVISVCNEGSHPVSCSNAGMDACDKEHSASISTPKLKKFRANAKRSVALQFKAATGMAIKSRVKLNR